MKSKIISKLIMTIGFFLIVLPMAICLNIFHKRLPLEDATLMGGALFLYTLVIGIGAILITVGTSTLTRGQQ